MSGRFMSERIIDGFVVRATTSPEEPGAPFYEPAFRFRPVAEKTDYEHVIPWDVTTQNVEVQTRENALAIAEDWLEKIEHVRWEGERWELDFDW